MNKRIIIGIILAILILGLGGFFLLRTQRSTQTEVRRTIESPTAAVSPTTTSGIFSGSVSDLIKRGGNFKCTWDSTVNNAALKGTAYISGNKYAAESNVSTAQMTIKANMIGDGVKMYIWTEIPNMPTIGTVMSYDQINAAKPTTAAETQQANNLLQRYNYNCEPWTPDSSKFIIPSNITFR